MPRQELTVIVSVPDGVNIVTGLQSVLAANGAQFAYHSRVRLLVTNGTGGTVTLTVQTPRTLPDSEGTALTVSDRTISIPAGQTYLVGPFVEETYKQADGKVYLDLSGTLSMVAFR